MIVTSIFLTYFLTLAWGKPIARDFVVHERRDSVPNGFTHKGPADASTSLNLRIALKSNDMAGLEKALYDVSTPGSDHYGHHLTKEEVGAFVAPLPHVTSTVHEWLADYGLTATKATVAGEWLSISINVTTANELLAADFSLYTHQRTGEETIRTLTYSIPSHVKEHIQTIQPTIHFSEPATKPNVQYPILPTRNVMSRDLPSCADLITPTCLNAMYGIPIDPRPQSSTTIGVAVLSHRYPQLADLNMFLKLFRTDMDPNTEYTVLSVAGGSDPQNISNAGAEPDLDLQYTLGLAALPTTAIIMGSDTPDDVWGVLDMVETLLSSNEPPSVLSMSISIPTLPPPLEQLACDKLMQLGAIGISVIASSGDTGVGSQGCTVFDPMWYPSTCASVTSVGGTQGIASEVAWAPTTGGFSNTVPRPSYQEEAVNSYLSQLGGTYAGLFNASGRAVPDVSAHAEVNAGAFIGGVLKHCGGTSFSGPIFASAIARLNEELAAQGRPYLGFLNPLLYSTPSALNDITSGNNPGCGTDGFFATMGWDPVTGLGTPNYAALQKAVGL